MPEVTESNHDTNIDTVPAVTESNRVTKKGTYTPCRLFLTVNMQYPIADACANMNKLQCTHCRSWGYCRTRRVSPVIPWRTGGYNTDKESNNDAHKPVEFRCIDYLITPFSCPGYLITNVIKIITHLKIKWSLYMTWRRAREWRNRSTILTYI